MTSQVQIARLSRVGCVQYNILTDDVVEGNEVFRAEISTVNNGATIGTPSATSVTILDLSRSNTHTHTHTHTHKYILVPLSQQLQMCQCAW